MHRVSYVLLIALIAIAGCTQESTAILKRVDLKNNEFFTTDARQRVITNSEIGERSTPGTVDPFRIVCTEPSPDVAIAVAHSFSTGLSVFSKGSGAMSGSEVTALAQLVERTASIQLLRDKMYQTCLAYSNGAISGTTYSLVMTKLDDTIVSLLLGETAGGAFGRSLAALTTEATGEATGAVSGPGGAGNVKALTDELKIAQANVDEKEAVLREKQQAIEGVESPTDEQTKAVTDAQTDVDNAKAQRDQIVQLLQSRADSMAKTSGKSAAIAGGGISKEASPLIAETLAEMQDQFLRKDFTDFVVTACATELARSPIDGTGAPQARSSLTQFCERNLNGFIAAALTSHDALEAKRLDAKLQVGSQREAVAHAEEQKARARAAEELKLAQQEFNKAVAACDKFSDAPLKKACIDKIPAQEP